MADIASKTFQVVSFVDGGAHQPVMHAITLTNAGTDDVTLVAGTVLGRITTGRKYVQHAPGASDGSQNAYRILVEDVTIPAGEDVKSVAYCHGAFRSAGLTFASGITETQKNAALDALADAGLYVR